jgi:hypothetical protein
MSMDITNIGYSPIKINLNFDSVVDVYNNVNKNDCNNVKQRKNPQAMIYGWKSCYYKNVKEILETSFTSPMNKVYNWQVNHPHAAKSDRTTLEGRVMKPINVPLKSSEDEQSAEYCKASLTTLMVENWKREQEGLPLIPLIFCYDVDGKKRVITPGSIASRDPQSNKIITNKELRRCYKLCCELEKDPELKAIAEVAKKSIQFVKLAGSDSTEYKMEILHPFWESPEFETKWKERMATKKPADPSKTVLWREELKSSMIAYNTNKQDPVVNMLDADEFNRLDSDVSNGLNSNAFNRLNSDVLNRFDSDVFNTRLNASDLSAFDSANHFLEDFN